MFFYFFSQKQRGGVGLRGSTEGPVARKCRETGSQGLLFDFYAADFNVDRHLFAQHDRSVLDVEIVAVDGGRSGKARTYLSFSCRTLAEEGYLEHHIFGHAAHGQLPFDLALLAVKGEHLGAFEGDFGELFDVEEVFGAQVFVTFFVVCVDTCGLDGGANPTLLGVLFVKVKGARELVKVAWDLGEEVSDFKRNAGVNWIDLELGSLRREGKQQKERKK